MGKIGVRKDYAKYHITKHHTGDLPDIYMVCLEFSELDYSKGSRTNESKGL